MVDLTFLYKFTKGNESKIKRYINMYLNIAPEIFERMKQDIENERWADLGINAHSLKPQVDFVGIAALKEILISIEDSVKNDETLALKDLFEKACQMHREASVILNNKINEM